GLGMKDIREMVAYWKKFGKELIYFSKLVIFEGFELEYTKTGVAAPAFKTVDYSEREELVNYLKEQNVHVVHATALFCGSSRNCPVEKDGKVLFVDNFHLSKYGAGLFGSDLIKNDPLFSHITQFETSP
ncbi:MAG: SGNH hydrolase domain-containing protein, partial [Pseudobdellovibrio sp.]